MVVLATWLRGIWTSTGEGDEQAAAPAPPTVTLPVPLDVDTPAQAISGGPPRDGGHAAAGSITAAEPLPRLRVRASPPRLADVAPTCEALRLRLARVRAAWERRKQDEAGGPVDADLFDKSLTSLEARQRDACESDRTAAKMQDALSRFATDALGADVP